MFNVQWLIVSTLQMMTSFELSVGFFILTGFKVYSVRKKMLTNYFNFYFAYFSSVFFLRALLASCA